MSDDLLTLRDYLAPPRDAFWKWDEDADAVLWADGRTIAFTTELAAILEPEQSYGLPSFSAVLLLLAACRDSWNAAPPPVHVMLGQFRWVDDHLAMSHQELAYDGGWLSALLENLHRVSELPRELRASTRAKSALLAALFEAETHRSGPAVAGIVIDVMQREEIPPLCVEPRTQHDLGRHVATIEAIRRLGERLAEFDLDSFRLRMETGLDREVLPADLEEPLAKRVRQLLDDLHDDEELAGLARLTRSLMAVTNLPRPLDRNEDLPIGGVSDIANRGTFDRLLLSELANDNEVLTMRVAMNEALYLRRETSTQTPPRQRVVIVDAGLRLWGVPRVFATSVALSLAALTESQVEFTTHRPEGNELAPVDFGTREGLIEHLHALTPEAHPGAALPRLQRDLAENEHEYDAILVTAEDVLADPEFQQALSAEGEPFRFIAGVARDGRFRMLERTPHGVKVLRDATLDLDQLLAPPRTPAQPLIEPDGQTELPAILRVSPFPLRLPHHMNWKQTWCDGRNRVFSVTNDYRLMLWDEPNKAARQLIESLPSRNVLWSDGGDHSKYFVVGNPGKSEAWLVAVDANEGDFEIVPLEGSTESIRGVSGHGGAVFVIRHKDIDVFTGGQRLTTTSIPGGTTWANDRFFRGPHRWCALSFDGLAPQFEEVINYHHYADLWQLTAMFDVEGIEGPVALSGIDGRMYHTTTRKEVPLQTPLRGSVRLLAKSRDGQHIVVEHCAELPGTRAKSMIHPVSGHVREFHYRSDPFATVLQASHLDNPTLYKRYRAVRVNGRSLVLETRKRRLLGLVLDSSRDFMKLSDRAEDCWSDVRGSWRIFEKIDSPRNARYGLQAAAWPDGSRAVLDSRGLLHLKSSDDNLPECSIVLSHNALAGWCSDGRKWGPPLYHDDAGRHVPAHEIWEEVIRPFLKHCEA